MLDGYDWDLDPVEVLTPATGAPFASLHEALQHGKTAAKPKGNRAPEEPTQQPMRPATQIRQSLSADQKRVRRQMTRKQATEESAMRTEATILREMATASLADQRVLAQELDDVRRARTASVAADREVDLADTIVRSHLTPVAVHTMHTAATDWVGEDEVHEDPSLAMKTEATLWFQRTSAEVRDDLEEFAIQAQGMATRLASRCGEQADAAFEAFIGHVDHLYRQAAKVAGDSRTIDPDKNNGNAESGLPLEVDNDDTAFDDPGFLNDDSDTGVHPDMPGAKKGSKTASDDDGQSCADCGASIERDPAGEDPRTWHHDDGDSHDHEATPKTSAKTANEDNFGGKKAPPFGSKDGDTDDDEDQGNDYDSDPDDPHYGEGAKADRLSDKESAKTAEQSPPEVDANTRLKDPETDPMLSEDWDHQSDDPETGTGAADVKDVPTPGGENGYPKPKNSMLDKAAAFRATVQANLER